LLTAFISTGELIKIVLLNDVIVDDDIGGAEGGGGLGGATRPITLEGSIGSKSVPTKAFSIFVILKIVSCTFIKTINHSVFCK
jgi:hypothetical protein